MCARLSACGKSDYQKQLAKELNVVGNSEMWQPASVRPCVRRVRSRHGQRHQRRSRPLAELGSFEAVAQHTTFVAQPFRLPYEHFAY